MNDRLAWCSYCEETYWEGNAELHEHPRERAAERQFLGIKEKGLETGWSERERDTFYSRKDAIRDGRSMRFLSKGKMRSTNKA